MEFPLGIFFYKRKYSGTSTKQRYKGLANVFARRGFVVPRFFFSYNSLLLGRKVSFVILWASLYKGSEDLLNAGVKSRYHCVGLEVW